MPILDFKEIPTAASGHTRDQFELFAREFLVFKGYRIVVDPDRGADAGRDMIVEEVRVGIGGETRVRWLVSCKHKAHSGASVGPDDEVSIIDRVKMHGCKGFLGVYSTITSSGLAAKLNSPTLEFETQVLDPEKIERDLLSDPEGVRLAQRFFPRSSAAWEAPKSAATIETLSELLRKDIERLSERLDQPGPSTGGLPTGLHDLDQVTDGLHSGDLVVVAARPGHGRHRFCLSVVSHVAVEQGVPVLVLSLRKGAGAYTRGLQANLARVSNASLLRGSLRDEDWTRFTAAVKNLVEAPIYIDEAAYRDFGELEELVKQLNAKCGRVALLVVDGIDELTRDAAAPDVRQRLLQNLRGLARAERCPILLTVPVTRDVEYRPNKRPTLADLGPWEDFGHAANVSLILYSDSHYDPTIPADERLTELIIARNVRGPIGTVRLASYPEFAMFTNDETPQNSMQPRRAAALPPAPRSSTTLFAERFASAFPGLRSTQWFEGETAVERLQLLLTGPLTFRDGAAGDGFQTPIWWFGDGNNGIERFRVLEPGLVLLNEKELRLGRVAAVYHASYKRLFVYVHALAMPPTGLYPATDETIAEAASRNGYAWEEYALVDGTRLISRAEYDDGHAIIDGRPQPISDQAELRMRYLTDYRFVICAQGSPLNNSMFDRRLTGWFARLAASLDEFDRFCEDVFDLPLRNSLR